MEQPIDYNKLFKDTVSKIDASGRKPSLFLHACCGPCLTYPLSVLVQHFDVTVGYFNPNIFPIEEYEKRLSTLENFVRHYSADQNIDIKVVVNQDDFEKYRETFKNRFQDKEGGPTCLRCHAYRMGISYEYAAKHGFEYFTTVMTVSCKKPSRELNEIAFALEKKYPQTKYLYSDFKKEDGQLKGNRIAKEYGLYRQNYCGCEVSLKERIEYQKRKANSPIPS